MSRLFIIFVSLFFSPVLHAAEGSFLNVVILELPERFLADVPLTQRIALMRLLSEYNNPGLDYSNGWLHFSGDGENPGSTSQFYVKLLPRGKHLLPLVFVHMAKPFADGSTPRTNQTFVLERNRDGWADVTAAVMPKGIDLTLHFRPHRRADPLIECGPWKRFQRRDGRGEAYTYGSRLFDLHWNGREFRSRKAAARVFSSD